MSEEALTRALLSTAVTAALLALRDAIPGAGPAERQQAADSVALVARTVAPLVRYSVAAARLAEAAARPGPAEPAPGLPPLWPEQPGTPGRPCRPSHPGPSCQNIGATSWNFGHERESPRTAGLPHVT